MSKKSYSSTFLRLHYSAGPFAAGLRRLMIRWGSCHITVEEILNESS